MSLLQRNSFFFLYSCGTKRRIGRIWFGAILINRNFCRALFMRAVELHERKMLQPTGKKVHFIFGCTVQKAGPCFLFALLGSYHDHEYFQSVKKVSSRLPGQDQNYSFQKQIGQKCCFVPLRTRFHHIRPQFYDLTLPKQILRSPNHSGLPTGKTHKPIQINENDRRLRALVTTITNFRRPFAITQTRVNLANSF